MASQVLSGSSNVSYTNNTGQNVRIVINYMSATPTGGISMTWTTVGVFAQISAIGRNLAYYNFDPSTLTSSSSTANNALGLVTPDPNGSALPTELMIAPGQTFSASCGLYNIVVIPEAG